MNVREEQSFPFFKEKNPDTIQYTTPPSPALQVRVVGKDGANDPSAGSPTETLLRLLLPLNDKV